MTTVRQLYFGLLLVGAHLLIASSVSAHIFTTPTEVTANEDGTFSYDCTFEAGPGGAFVAGYSWEGWENTDGSGTADCFCEPEICTMEAGETTTFQVWGWLVDPDTEGSMLNTFSLCDESDLFTFTRVLPSETSGIDVGQTRERSFSIAPNPMIRGTELQYSTRSASSVQLAIHSVSGALVRELVTESQSAGHHVVPWDGTDPNGVRVSGGIYFAVLTIDGATQTHRVVVIE
jgi:hypothetical protein